MRVINPDGQETVTDSAFTYEAPELAVDTLQKLLTTLGEVKYTVLLQNYPNPFNPETWIPYVLYQLHVSSEVSNAVRSSARSVGTSGRDPAKRGCSLYRFDKSSKIRFIC